MKRAGENEPQNERGGGGDEENRKAAGGHGDILSGETKPRTWAANSIPRDFVGTSLSGSPTTSNAFFHPTGWIAAGGAAFGIGFLFVGAFVDRRRPLFFVLAGPSRESCARYTSPIPPAPRSATIS